MNTWTFVEFKRDSDYYSWSLRRNKDRETLNSSISEKDAESVKQFFKVKEDYQVLGMNFKSKESDPFAALEMLILKTKNNGCYRKPNHETVINKCIKALAELEEPDLSKIDKMTIYEAFRKLWGEDRLPNPEWIKSFKEQIFKASKGNVCAKEAKGNRNGKLPKVLGPHYFLDLANKSGYEITIVVGPYNIPIEIVRCNFVKKNRKPA